MAAQHWMKLLPIPLHELLWTSLLCQASLYMCLRMLLESFSTLAPEKRSTRAPPLRKRKVGMDCTWNFSAI